MANRPHIKLNSQIQKEQVQTMRFNYGFGESQPNDTETPVNYMPMASAFKNSLRIFRRELSKRRQERNMALAIPRNIEYIQITFQDQFDISTFYQNWRNVFGIQGVRFTNFNKEVLFAIEDTDKFEEFLSNIQRFIDKETGEDPNASYEGKVKFVQQFKLLTSEDIIQPHEDNSLLSLRLVDFPAGSSFGVEILEKLREYLGTHQIAYREYEEIKSIEVANAEESQILEIVRNFDIIHAVTSSFSTVVRPSSINTASRTYGFTIPTSSIESLPIIGILDTGVSNLTPLSSIVIDTEDFNLTDSSVFIDNAVDGYGHGTAVAALAAFGRRPYNQNYRGQIHSDARLLSMKLLDGDSGTISPIETVELLKKAKNHYPSIKLFTLTICYRDHKKTNENHSSYASMLDRFAHENDCIIFICTANNNQSMSENDDYSIQYFENEVTNLCTPAESMNNVTIGVAADNLTNTPFQGISPGREFPTIYTRKGHIDLASSSAKKNDHLFKPDLIEAGGDLEKDAFGIGAGNNAVIEVLSSNPSRGFYKDVGTSFSTPLAANMAAQIQGKYPSLRAQSIKALMLNAASLDLIRFPNTYDKLKNRVAGNGIGQPEKSVQSTNNEVTFILEDQIKPDEMKVFPIRFPDYLTQDDLGKKVGILRVTSTLCFSFKPVMDNHLGYCPIQMAFAFFRNHEGHEILTKEDTIASKFKKGWSQDNRWKRKPVPSSNTQKVSFLIGTQDLLSEANTLKLAIHCRLSPQILSSVGYEGNHQFSMAITIKENLREGNQTNKLYDEIIAINEIQSITQVDTDGQIELDL